MSLYTKKRQKLLIFYKYLQIYYTRVLSIYNTDFNCITRPGFNKYSDYSCQKSPICRLIMSILSIL